MHQEYALFLLQNGVQSMIAVRLAGQCVASSAYVNGNSISGAQAYVAYAQYVSISYKKNPQLV